MSALITHDMPDPDYRAIPAAHYSGLKTILDCPARYRWERDHRTDTDAYDFGHVVHGMVLGVGEPSSRLDFPDRRTKLYREAADAARAAGTIPLLASVYDKAERCADAIREHPLAGPIITRDGHSEVTVQWVDERTEIPCKARIDRVTVTPDDTHWLVDLKTVGQTANPRRFGKVAGEYGYHIQAAFYLDGYATAADIPHEQVRWLNVIAETSAPHMVSVTEFDAEALNTGHTDYAAALDVWQHCYATDDWPGYTLTESAVVSLPYYLTHRQETTDD